ncbi:hypothetical protein [Rhodomicrobium sp.]|uniref:hypothetical protein n=1 Tax=Rhodomicrobium sp. TaxID=2720632 RepID=UPI0039E54C2F
MRAARFWLCAAAISALPWAATAQTKGPADKPRPEATAKSPEAKPEIRIEAAELAMLIKSTILALQHANQTGNYSVLRDMGSPVFRERFDQAQVTAFFANLRARKINLTPVLLLAPNLTKNPELTENRKLRIVGNFPTQPLQVQYDLSFIRLDGVWRVEGIAVDAVKPQAVAAVPQKPTAETAPAKETSLKKRGN